eukprot:711486-Rhodomonas_salina.3
MMPAYLSCKSAPSCSFQAIIQRTPRRNSRSAICDEFCEEEKGNLQAVHGRCKHRFLILAWRVSIQGIAANVTDKTGSGDSTPLVSEVPMSAPYIAQPACGAQTPNLHHVDLPLSISRRSCAGISPFRAEAEWASAAALFLMSRFVLLQFLLPEKARSKYVLSSRIKVSSNVAAPCFTALILASFMIPVVLFQHIRGVTLKTRAAPAHPAQATTSLLKSIIRSSLQTECGFVHAEGKKTSKDSVPCLRFEDVCGQMFSD